MNVPAQNRPGTGRQAGDGSISERDIERALRAGRGRQRSKRLSADLPQHWLNAPPYFALSDPAWRLLTNAMMWAIGRTDGFIPDAILPTLLPGRDLAAALAAAGELADTHLWTEKPGGWQHVGWEHTQSTVEQIEDSRAADRNRQASYRARKAAELAERERQVAEFEAAMREHQEWAGEPADSDLSRVTPRVTSRITYGTARHGTDTGGSSKAGVNPDLAKGKGSRVTSRVTDEPEPDPAEPAEAQDGSDEADEQPADASDPAELAEGDFPFDDAPPLTLTCARHGCGGHYVNDESGWAAHLAVFGHAPGSDDEPPPEEGTPE